MAIEIPGLIMKTISFKRLSNHFCSGYEIWYKYNNGDMEHVEDLPNPVEPSPLLHEIILEQKEDPVWTLPTDIYMDRDHKIRLYHKFSSGSTWFILPSLKYNINKVTRQIGLDTTMEAYDMNDSIKLQYYRDRIVKTYTLEENCDIVIKPIFTQSYAYGDHNVII